MVLKFGGLVMQNDEWKCNEIAFQNSLLRRFSIVVTQNRIVESLEKWNVHGTRWKMEIWEFKRMEDKHWEREKLENENKGWGLQWVVSGSGHMDVMKLMSSI